jgi:CBS domain-containing protein
MTRHPLALAADTPLRDALASLLRHGLHAAPVVDARGRVRGMLSQTDLLPLAAGSASSATADLARLQYVCGEPRDAPPLSLRTGQCTAGAALPPGRPLIAVPRNAPLPEAAALMLHHGLHTLPVVAPHSEEEEEEDDEAVRQHWRSRGASAEQAEAQDEGAPPPRLLGVVSRADILRAVLAAAEREDGGSSSNGAAGLTLTVIAQPLPPAPAPPAPPAPPRSGAWRVQRLEQRRGGVARFYEQRIERSCDGLGGSFVRTARWGRVGAASDTAAAGAAASHGRPPRLSDYHASAQAASAALDAVTAAKLRQGYVVVSDESANDSGGAQSAQLTDGRGGGVSPSGLYL